MIDLPIDETINEERVHGHPPVRWGWVINMIVPFSPVVKGIGGCLVLVQIVSDLVWSVFESSCQRNKCKDCGEDPEVHHQPEEAFWCSDCCKARLQTTKAF